MSFDYKKYSLENLENWLHDVLSCEEASPHEIYDVIKSVIEEQYYYHKQNTQRCYELLALLNGNGKGHVKSYDDCVDKILSCDKDDPSPECQDAWDDFWEQSYLSGITDTPEEAEELRAEIEKIREEGGYEWTPQTSQDVQHSKYYYEYNRNDPNRKAPMYCRV